MENPPSSHRKWYHFNIRKTPCAKDSLLNGIIIGGIGGVAYYLKSGVVKRSCDIAVGGFIVTAFICWNLCIYQKKRTRAQLNKAMEVMNKNNSIKDTNNNNNNN
uniref:Cytochrome c oxidase assembly protein COX20, mitochondrial n=1 Tax=Amphimedon queenslandica TaxID=400682 RepID=A0A1X7V4T5_AMPQE